MPIVPIPRAPFKTRVADLVQDSTVNTQEATFHSLLIERNQETHESTITLIMQARYHTVLADGGVGSEVAAGKGPTGGLVKMTANNLSLATFDPADPTALPVERYRAAMGVVPRMWQPVNPDGTFGTAIRAEDIPETVAYHGDLVWERLKSVLGQNIQDITLDANGPKYKRFG